MRLRRFAVPVLAGSLLVLPLIFVVMLASLAISVHNLEARLDRADTMVRTVTVQLQGTRATLNWVQSHPVPGPMGPPGPPGSAASPPAVLLPRISLFFAAPIPAVVVQPTASPVPSPTPCTLPPGLCRHGR